MDQMGYDGTINNPYTLIGFSNFVSGDVRRCCFTAYFTTFDVKTVKISKTCRDDKKEFDFNFTVTHCNADFMVARWETDLVFRKSVDDFIKAHPSGGDFFDEKLVYRQAGPPAALKFPRGCQMSRTTLRLHEASCASSIRQKAVRLSF